MRKYFYPRSVKLKLVWVLFLCAWIFSSFGCTEKRSYEMGLIDVGLNFAARSFCSCLFVTNSSEKKCRNFASAKRISPSLRVDMETKETQSRLLYIFTQKARYMGPESGCQLID